VGTVSGLALLAGGTAVAAVAGGAHSVFATVLLGMLTVGMSHALLTEVRRQARRRTIDGWAAQDTVNTVLLASWSGGALIATLLAVAPASVRAVGLLLTLGYAVSCVYFVAERRRAIAGDGLELPEAASGEIALPASGGVTAMPASGEIAAPTSGRVAARSASGEIAAPTSGGVAAEPADRSATAEAVSGGVEVTRTNEPDPGKVPAESA
jgi:hypothetical protein